MLGRAGLKTPALGQWSRCCGGTKGSREVSASEAEIVSFSPLAITESGNGMIMKSHCSLAVQHRPNYVHSLD